MLTEPVPPGTVTAGSGCVTLPRARHKPCPPCRTDAAAGAGDPPQTAAPGSWGKHIRGQDVKSSQLASLERRMVLEKDLNNCKTMGNFGTACC